MTIEANREYVRAGGYLPIDAKLPKDELVDTIGARTFTHRALGDRPIVRLTPANLAEGEDSSMNYLGFNEPEVREKIAQRQRQPLGFPEWVLVHDPKNAGKALETAKQMKRFNRMAKSKPGNAKDNFDSIGKALEKKTPQFLPSYYEQVGRAFLEAGNTQYAATMFGKARNAEAVYALEVDEERRREAFLEFALSGALTNKVTTDYAKDLAVRYGDAKAYEMFFDLCVRRTLGGTPPSAGLIDQLRRCYRAAKLKAADEDLRFVEQVWEAPSLTKSARKVWKTYYKAFAALAKDKPAVRGRLLNLFPAPSGSNDEEGMKAEWIEFLTNCGALQGVTAKASDVPAGAGPEGSAAKWYVRMHDHSFGGWYWSSRTQPDEMFTLLRDMADRLKDDGDGLAFDSEDYYASADIDIVDLGLELEIPFAEFESFSFVSLDRWAEPPEESEELGRQLEFVGADERFHQSLEYAVSSAFGNASFRRKAVSTPGLFDACARWLENRIAGLGGHAVPEFGEAIGVVQNNTDAVLFRRFPDEFAQLKAFDPTPALQRTLEIGFLDEMKWPALEEALTKFNLDDDDNYVRVGGAFPYAVIYDNIRAVVVGGTGIIAEHDFRLPKGKSPYALFFAGGQLMVCFYNENWDMSAYWSSNPNEVFEISGYPSTPGYSCDTKDGGTSFGGRALYPGDKESPTTGVMVSDGETFWAREGYYYYDEGISWHEIDPKSGNKGRKSLPAFWEAWADADHELDMNSMGLFPVPEGVENTPWGQKDGICGWRSRKHKDSGEWECEAIDGRGFKGYLANGSKPNGLFTLPGDDAPRPVDGGFWSPDGKLKGSYMGAADPAMERVPFEFLTFVQPRDEKGSKALRKATIEQASAVMLIGLIASKCEAPGSSGAAPELGEYMRRLLDTKPPKSIAGPGKAMADFFIGDSTERPPEKFDAAAAAGDVFPEISDAGLLAGVAHQASYGAQHVQTWVEILRGSDPDSVNEADLDPSTSLGDEEAWKALQSFFSSDSYYYYYGSGGSLADALTKVSAFLFDGDVAEPPSLYTPWTTVLGNVGAVAFASTLPEIDKSIRESLLKFLGVWANTRFCEDFPGRLRFFNLEYEEDDQDKVPGAREDGESVFLEHEGNRFYIINENYYERMRGVQWAPEGDDFVLLPHTTLEESRELVVDGWGTPDEITAFLEQSEEHGPSEFSVEAAQDFAARTGLTYGEASLLLAGLPNVNAWEKNFLPKPLREAMGLKVAEADIARQTMRNIDQPTRIGVFAAGMNGNPFDLLEGEDDSAVAHMAAKWNSMQGQKVSLPEELLADLEKNLEINTAIRDILTGIVAPEKTRFGQDVETEVDTENSYNPTLVGKGDINPMTAHDMASAMAMISYLSGSLPVEDETRALIPAFYDNITARLNSGELLFNLGSEYFYGDDGEKQAERYLQSIGGDRREDGESKIADDGVVMAIAHGYYVNKFFRPHLLMEGKSHPMLDKKDDDNGYYYYGRTDGDKLVKRFISDDFKAFVERIKSAPFEEGYEANPKLSVPDLVLEVGSEYDLSENASILFLQTLALPNCTTANVRKWNGWTPKPYTTACEELKNKKLLLEAKRARAGRKHFLPGGWDALKKPNLPIEAWKRPLFDSTEHGSAPLGQILLLKPHHLMFEEAWKRVKSGDTPGF